MCVHWCEGVFWTRFQTQLEWDVHCLKICTVQSQTHTHVCLIHMHMHTRLQYWWPIGGSLLPCCRLQCWCVNKVGRQQTCRDEHCWQCCETKEPRLGKLNWAYVGSMNTEKYISTLSVCCCVHPLFWFMRVSGGSHSILQQLGPVANNDTFLWE